MDKTGIITFHETTNFGSLLQTFGLYKAIENLGYECEVIDYKCESIQRRELPTLFRIPKSIKDFAKMLLIDTKAWKKLNALNHFLYDHMILSQSYVRSSIYQAEKDYSRIIVGSDIVWGLDITNNDTTYFLDFVKNDKKKFAFSSSIGDPWSAQEKDIVKPFLSSFNKIAVREDESADWVEELTATRPEVVCDPTMLLTKDEWLKNASRRFKDKKYIIVYFDTPKRHCIELAKRIGKEKGLPVYFINYGVPIKGVKNLSIYKLEDFLSALANASYVITASYHGLLFSTYFGREVWYFNRAHKSRMATLARRLGIENRDGEYFELNKGTQIDYGHVTASIDIFRRQSMDVLSRFFKA